MIRYALTCDQDHRFESWFASADAFDGLAQAGRLSCPACGSAQVSKALMAPALAAESASAPEHPLAALRRKIETESTYVGPEFARTARAMHEGELPDRPIHGEAAPEEARALLEDGVPVLPLPFLPPRKVN